MEKNLVPKKTSFLSYIHEFRGLAILLIVSSHILMEDMDNIFYIILSAIFLNSTLFFVFVSGYLFQYLSDKYEIGKFWKRKLNGIIIPYILISIPAIILRVYTVPENVVLRFPDFNSWNLFQKVGYFYISGSHLLPFWFIPMIILFFIISPFLVFLDKDKRVYYLLPLLIIISSFFPRNDITQINDTFRMFIHFFSIYILGMFCSRYMEKIDLFISKYWFPILVSSIIIFIISCFQFVYVIEVIFYQKILFCFVIMFFLKKKKEGSYKLLDFLAKWSFGIYFVHYYLIIVLRKIFSVLLGHSKPIWPIEWFIHYFIVLFLTIGVIRIVKYLAKDKSKYLIGC